MVVPFVVDYNLRFLRKFFWCGLRKGIFVENRAKTTEFGRGMGWEIPLLAYAFVRLKWAASVGNRSLTVAAL
jgi:hypothetical protein